MKGSAPGGKPGKSWTTRYTAVGLNGLGKTALLDGMNDTGRVGGMLCLPGHAPLRQADPAGCKSRGGTSRSRVNSRSGRLRGRLSG